jgi:hypothetical protein
MSIRCKAFVCVGVLAVAGIISVILWKTLGAQSTSNETEHTKNQTENGKTIENDLVKGTSRK